MAEPALGARAALVRRYDPDLFATALFAAEPGRGRLMTLYAVDIELSRAVHAARRAEAGPLIAAMRLQWWRDVAEAARSGAAPPEHEIAGPFADLAAGGLLPEGALAALFDGHEAEIAGTLSEAGFASWAEGRFGGLLRLAAAALGAGDPHPMREPDPLPEPLTAAWAAACGSALALRSAAAMAREGRSLVPGLTGSDRAALASGRLEPALTAKIAALAAWGRHALAEARCHARGLPRRYLPALLPVWSAERTLRRVARDPLAILEPQPPANPAARALGLMWRAARGRV